MRKPMRAPVFQANPERREPKGEASHQEVFFVELVSEFAGDDGGDGGGEHAGGNDPRVHGLGTV